MARRRGPSPKRLAVSISCDIWQDPSWRTVSSFAQYTYLMVAGQPRPGSAHEWPLADAEQWATLSRETSAQDLLMAMDELEDAGWVEQDEWSVRLLRSDMVMPPSACGHVETERARLDWGLRRRVFSEHGRICRACGATENLCIDHVVALAAGGTSDIDNLAVLCRSCNSSKGTKPWDAWMRGRA